MISPFTKPGTKVEFIGGDAIAVTSCGRRYNGALPFVEGRVYTLDSVEQTEIARCGFVAYLAEEPSYFVALYFLRRLELPDSLTSLLNTQKSDAEAGG